MRRYAKRLGTVTIGNASVDGWIVIRTDEVAPHEAIAKGFLEVATELSDAEAMAKYSVERIHLVTNRKLAEN